MHNRTLTTSITLHTLATTGDTLVSYNTINTQGRDWRVLEYPPDNKMGRLIQPEALARLKMSKNTKTDMHKNALASSKCTNAVAFRPSLRPR